jgi:murein DD-endopeptidase MepM/ murein hydrolase activator NlpD
MSALNKVKKMENTLYRRLAARSVASAKRLVSRFGRLRTAGGQKLTVMLIPHDEKRIANFELNFFSIAGITLAVAAAVVGLGFAAYRLGGASSELREKSEELASARANLDSLRDEANRLVEAAKDFRVALAKSLGKAGMKVPEAYPSAPSDLADLFGGSSGGARVREIDDIAKVGDFLERSIVPVKEFGSSLSNQTQVLGEIPNIWPIRNGIGHISMYFGQNENPFTGQWYTHMGIDISTFGTGDPIVATASGVVVAVSYDNGYGNNLIIRHRHGFYTRYGHMQRVNVYRGQVVKQGQVIGLLGNTGLTTGPHVHYEVHLGRSVIDPLKFLNVKSSAISLTSLPSD